MWVLNSEKIYYLAMIDFSLKKKKKAKVTKTALIACLIADAATCTDPGV